MLSIAEAKGGGEYYLALAQEDYYLEGGEPPGNWWGTGAAEIGLKGEIDKAQFRNIMGGFSPTGASALVRNAGADDRRAAWDLTFSAPKSVSVLWAAGPADRDEIGAAHRAAVHAALGYLEDTAAFSRRGSAGADQVRARLAVGIFDHGTARSVDGQTPDPQLHSHCLVMNVCTAADGRTATIESRHLFRAKMAAGAIYRAELAHQIETRLGLKTIRTRSTFEILGIPDKAIQFFSKRRQQIETSLRERGATGAKASAIATLDTRESKKLHLPRAELFPKWEAECARLGISPAQIARLQQSARADVDHPQRRDETVNAALSSLLERRAHFSERELVGAIAVEAQGRGLSSTSVLSAAAEAIADGRTIVDLGDPSGERRFTTNEVLRQEADLLERIDRSSGDTRHLVDNRTLERSIERMERRVSFTLSPEQRDAVSHLTTTSGSVKVVTGIAGTGKSAMLDAAREVWVNSGEKTIGATLSGKAARGLESSSGIASATIARFLLEQQRGPFERTSRFKIEFRYATWQTTKKERDTCRSKNERASRFELTPKTVLVIDEAAMVDTVTMGKLLALAEAASAKVVLVGDPKQLPPIQAGQPFGAISKRLGASSLTDIRRQDQLWARKAVADIANGNTRDALRAFQDRDLVTVKRTRGQAMDALLADWKKSGAKEPDSHLIIASTNAEVGRLNRSAQEARASDLGSQSVKVGSDRIYSGDRVLFRKNRETLGVSNGDLGTVLGVSPLRRLIRVRLDRGDTVSIPLKSYQELSLGYAVTTHKAQGDTVCNSYVLAGGQMSDRALSYVQLSRAQNETRIYTDKESAGPDLAELTRAMSRETDQRLAHEVLEQDQPV